MDVFNRQTAAAIFAVSIIMAPYSAAAVDSVELTDAERHKLYESITALSLVPPPKPWTPELGGKVPEEVHLNPVPSSLQMTNVIRYRYAVSEGKVVLADPLTREIVAVIGKE